MKNLKENKNIHIVGLSGAEGSAIALFLVSQGLENITAHDFSKDKEEFAKNFNNTHLDLKPFERKQELEKILALPIKINFRDKYLDGILDADIALLPSSWYLYPQNFPTLALAKKRCVTFSSMTNLYFDLAPCPIISVTGTKGKGTTSRLIYEILKLAEIDKKIKGKAYLGGNDRRGGQVLQALPQMSKDDVLVLETSNRQLMTDLLKSPYIGVITNITPDHIEEHGNFESYVQVKKSLIHYQKKGDHAVLNYDNEITRQFIEEFPKTAFPFSRKKIFGKGAFVQNGKILVKTSDNAEEICALSDIGVPGEHNVENVLAAVAATYLYGVPKEIIREGVKNFKGLKHRIEYLGEFGGARIYDDLASTTPESTIAAIETLADQAKDHELILVGGGDTKGGDYSGLAKTISEKVDALILLPGTGTDMIKSEKLKFIEVKDFTEVLETLRSKIKAGDIVLISPACAYFQSRYIDILKKSLKKLISQTFDN